MVAGKWPVQPELAAAGLWTTPTELARWGLEVSNAWAGRGSALLSQRMAAEMLTVQKPPYGLGVYLEGTDRAFSFFHAGSIWGFRALLVMFPAVGKGAVVMTNADRGDTLISELVAAIAAEYGWPARTPTERDVVTLTPEQMEDLVGAYALPPAPSGAPVSYLVSLEGGQLFGELRGLGSYPRTELYPSSPDSFFTTSRLPVVFARDDSGRVVKVRMGQIEGIRNQENAVP